MATERSEKREVVKRCKHDLEGLKGGGADVALHKGARDGATAILGFLCVDEARIATRVR